jgi:hypothetical protein
MTVVVGDSSQVWYLLQANHISALYGTWRGQEQRRPQSLGHHSICLTAAEQVPMVEQLQQGLQRVRILGKYKEARIVL